MTRREYVLFTLPLTNLPDEIFDVFKDACTRNRKRNISCMPKLPVNGRNYADMQDEILFAFCSARDWKYWCDLTAKLMNSNHKKLFTFLNAIEKVAIS